MTKASPGILWPLRVLPTLVPHMAGTFPMIARDAGRTYQHPTIALHLHDYTGDFWIGRKPFRLEPGDITFSPPDTLSRYDLSEGGSHLCFHFQPIESERQAQVVLPFHLRLGPQTAPARERIWRVIDHARQAGGRTASPAAAAASATALELLMWLHLQSRRTTTPRRNNLIDSALTKLKSALENSISKPVSIADLAAGAGLSPDYLARLFAQRYGMSLQHYLLLRRIELARHLLKASDLLVSEVGRRAGLPDPQYFNKQFRRVVGESPLAYRQREARKRVAKQTK